MYLVKKLPETVVKWQIHRFVCFFTHKTILYYFFRRKKLFLSITNFSPYFYQLARLAEQNNSFFAKYLTNFSPIQYVYNGRSPFVVERNNIYLKKKILCSHQEVHEFLDLSQELSTLVLIHLNVAKSRKKNFPVMYKYDGQNVK